MREFSHLHCHTQWSLLDGQSRPDDMAAKAADQGQAAIAITDHGNMFGLYHFASACEKHGLKPILGCELYLVTDRHKHSFKRKEGEKDKRYHQLALAMTEQGYRNLVKMCSLGFLEGMYMGYPRVDKEVIEKYSEGVAFTTCCIGGEVPQAIIHGDLKKAHELVKWWVDLVGPDKYFVELQRHRGLEDIDGLGISQEDVNQELLKIAKKFGLKVICTNDSHYTEQKDNRAHDALLCLGTGQKVNMPERKFKFSSSDYYFKKTQEMADLFSDVPDALENTSLIADQAWEPNILRDILMPEYEVPNGKSQDEYLFQLSQTGATKRYGLRASDDVIRERGLYELGVIKKMGFAGYFLIVADLIKAAREMGVKVGPGRGSAAGSIVAYCLGITDVDPIEHGLLFERFINPDRISFPDIDIDFDDIHRHKVVSYVLDKYAADKVARIVTYSHLQAKAALRDMGRVLGVDQYEVNKVVGLWPDKPGMSLRSILEPDFAVDELEQEDQPKAKRLRDLAAKPDAIGKMVRTAGEVEGNVRTTSMHACGYIISPVPVSDIVPVSKTKGEELQITQVSNDHVESAGLLKMDFLGLRTLSTLKEAERIILESKGVVVDADRPPAEDPKALELFASGHTVGVFQFESAGMRRYLRDLKPDRFADVVAMVALYRPGPMQYIPDYVDRRHGRKEISYDLECMEEVLAETYGVTVYQESVMKLSQIIAGFTGGQADTLRKGIGKKKAEVIASLKADFLAGALANGHPEDVLNKIWADWEHFAQYSFNKSHAVAYAAISYRCAYLKAHYPAEYMAAYLATVQGKADQTKAGLRECRRMGIKVHIPNVNYSQLNMSVANGDIYFGLSNIKGVGSSAALLIERRPKKGWLYIKDTSFKTTLKHKAFCKFITDTYGGAVTAGTYKALAAAGALDSFGHERNRLLAQITEKQDYFGSVTKGLQSVKRKRETAMRQYHRALVKAEYVPEQMEHALDGCKLESDFVERNKSESDNSAPIEPPKDSKGEPIYLRHVPDQISPPPAMPEVDPVEQLMMEHDALGMFVSGHPIDSVEHQLELGAFTNAQDCPNLIGERLALCGYIMSIDERISRKGTPWAIIKMSDQSCAFEIRIFSRNIQAWKNAGIYEEGKMVAVIGKVTYDQMGQGWGMYVDAQYDAHKLHETSPSPLCIDLSVIDPDSAIGVMAMLREAPQGRRDVYVQMVNGEGEKKLKKFPQRILLSDGLLRALYTVDAVRYQLGPNPKAIFEKMGVSRE